VNVLVFAVSIPGNSPRIVEGSDTWAAAATPRQAAKNVMTVLFGNINIAFRSLA
jgi:hypothetical protein